MNIFCVLLLFIIVGASAENTIISRISNHVSKNISDAELETIAELSDTTYTNTVLDNILIPRVVGSTNHNLVHNYIKSELQNHGLSVKVDEFEAVTPVLGTLRFRNIIATTSQNADRYLVLACHYDSKYFEDFMFVGATDSAVPCAMLLNLVKTLREPLAALTSSTTNTNLALKLIFFDGEEAFGQWTDEDSLYGARHLASVTSAVDLLKIDVIVLLDLLGAPHPTIYGHFADTEPLYYQMLRAERRLARQGLFAGYSTMKPYFYSVLSGYRIEDDHVPFMKKGVPILHVIPTPFPSVWHTAQDNRDALDIDTVENLNRILRVFVVQYLHLTI